MACLFSSGIVELNILNYAPTSAPLPSIIFNNSYETTSQILNVSSIDEKNTYLSMLFVCA